MDSDAMWQDSRSLLDYGFAQLKLRRVIPEGAVMKTIRVTDGVTGEIEAMATQSVDVPVLHDENPDIIVETQLPGKIAAPVKAGDKVGVAKIFFNGKEIKEIDLLAAKGDRQKSFFALIHSLMAQTVEEICLVLKA